MIKTLLLRYGKYGIGVKKSYAKEQGITPVHYIHNKSILLGRLVRALNNKDDELAKFIPYFFKSYSETIYSNKKEITRRYYDERGWRYVPSKPDIINLRTVKSAQKRENQIKAANLKIEKSLSP
jgi:hypothetical protein